LTTKIVPSPFQKAIYYNVAKEKGHLIVEALAGSGKTTTLIESFKFVPRGKKTIALAFNKIIQEELKSRAPSYVEALTFHSLGLRAIKQRFGAVTTDWYKIDNIIKDIDKKIEHDLADNIKATVEQCRNALIDHPKGIDALISQFGIDTCEMDRKEFILFVIKVLTKDKSITDIIDFGDMCYFPFVYNLNLGKYDYVYVDEYQDLNKAQLVMAKKCANPIGGRIIIFGDRYQDLYSWRGSDSTLVEELKEETDTKILTLPISYRCPVAITTLARSWARDIQPTTWAKQGSIDNITLTKLYQIIKPGCFVLSRTNAPLIKVCMALIRQGTRANIRGRDIGSQLSSLIKKSKKKQIPAFLKWLENWKDEEVEKLRAKKMNPENVLDRVECLTNLCDELSSLEEVKKKIDELFNDTDEKSIVILSSVHRAKGLEREVVYLLKWTFRAWLDNVPHGMTENEEMNIAYVAATRTKDALHLVHKDYTPKGDVGGIITQTSMGRFLDAIDCIGAMNQPEYEFSDPKDDDLMIEPNSDRTYMNNPTFPNHETDYFDEP